MGLISSDQLLPASGSTEGKEERQPENFPRRDRWKSSSPQGKSRFPRDSKPTHKTVSAALKPFSEQSPQPRSPSAPSATYRSSRSFFKPAIIASSLTEKPPRRSLPCARPSPMPSCRPSASAAAHAPASASPRRRPLPR